MVFSSVPRPPARRAGFRFGLFHGFLVLSRANPPATAPACGAVCGWGLALRSFDGGVARRFGGQQSGTFAGQVEVYAVVLRNGAGFIESVLDG